MRGFIAGIAAIAVLFGFPASAHETWPAYLDVRQTSENTYQIFFRVPVFSQQDRPDLHLQLPDQARDIAPPEVSYEPGAHVLRRKIEMPGGLAAQTIVVGGLSTTLMDVLVRVEQATGSIQIERLTPERNAFVIATDPASGQIAPTYLRIGIEHILGGVDHLLFVFGLLLLLTGWKQVVLAITAFTVAHSITLAGATFGLIQVPEAPLNAAIALSILFLGAEVVRSRRGEATIGSRYPWLLSFGFGLIHGCGFASGLAATGLPPSDIPAALLFFNLGVEIGQLAFVALYFLLLWSIRTLEMPSPRWATLLPAYVVGTAGAYWTIVQMQPFLAMVSA